MTIQVRLTSLEELYTVAGAVLAGATGRPWWQHSGIQSRPDSPYATLYFMQCDDIENGVVEEVELPAPVPADGEYIREVHLGTTVMECRASFYRSTGPGDSALEAALRFRNALRMEVRFRDLWQIAGLVGGSRIVDISAIFRGDVEPRADVTWKMYANIADPLPLTGIDISEISTQDVGVTHVGLDDEETLIDIEITNPV
jgi:hypothetical protein